MRPWTAIAGTAVIAALSAASIATGQQAPPAGAHDGVVKARQASFLMSAALVGQIKAAIDRGDDPKSVAFPARSLARWSAALPAMFPPGSNTAGTEALPAVWSDRAGFEAKAAAYNQAATRLAELAGASDRDGFRTQFAAMLGTCKACHDTYRKPQEPRGN